MSDKKDMSVAIIGAGAGGIMAAIKLRPGRHQPGVGFREGE